MTIPEPLKSPPPPGRRPSVYQWCVVIALAVASLGLIMGLVWPTSTAMAQATGAEGVAGRMFVVAGQLTAKTYGLYLVDLERESLLVYEYTPHAQGGKCLQLRAARTLRFDTQLESYNTSPDPAEVADMVRQARKISGGTIRPQ